MPLIVGPVRPANKFPAFGVPDGLGDGLGVPVGEPVGEGLGVPVGELVGLGNGEPVGDGVGVTEPNVPDSTAPDALDTCTGIPSVITGTVPPLFVSISKNIVLNWLTVAWPTTALFTEIIRAVPPARLID
jgi:hypothetical protein